jgi:hypothetical protein
MFQYSLRLIPCVAIFLQLRYTGYMIYRNVCQTCGREWPCTKVLTKCLSCCEKDGEVYS